MNLDQSDSFADVGRALGADVVLDSRAAVAADLDGNGKLDLVINNNAAEPSILLNAVLDRGNWLLVDLEARTGVRDAVGARVVVTVGAEKLARWVTAGTGYAAQAPYTLHFGLGNATAIDQLEVTWPSGQTDRWQVGAINRRIKVLEGHGIE